MEKAQKLWLPIVTDSAVTSPYYKTHGSRQRSDLRRAQSLSQSSKEEESSDENPNWGKAQDQDNSSRQQTTT